MEQPQDGMLAQLLIKQGELSTQVAVVGANVANIDAKLDSIGSDHESRIRALERFRWTIAGGSFFGGIIAGLVGYLAGHLVR